MDKKLQFILEQIKLKNYTLLPGTISTGIVYKIHCDGDLDCLGFEKGFLVMTNGSSIKEHKHVENVERYKVLVGNLKINGIEQNENICLLGESHSIDVVDKLTIIETFKVDKKMLAINDDFVMIKKIIDKFC